MDTMFLRQERIEDKMKNKKFTLLFSISLLSVILLCGCQKNQPNTKNENLKNEVVTQTPSAESSIEPSIEPTNTPQVEEMEVTETPTVIKVKHITAKQMEKKIAKKLKVEKLPEIYSNKYQATVVKILDTYKKKNKYTIEKPLLIDNPYGTLTNAIYLYYLSNSACNISYEVSELGNDTIHFSGELYSNEEKQPIMEHEGILLGTIPGKINVITIKEISSDGSIVNLYQYQVDLTKNKEVQTMQLLGESSEETWINFYALYFDTAQTTKLPLLDHRGNQVIRLKMPQVPNTDIIKAKDVIYIPVTKQKIVAINRLGHVVNFYSLKDYEFVKELKFQEENGILYFVGKESKKKSKDQFILSLNLKTGKTKIVVDAEETFKDLYQQVKEQSELTLSKQFEIDSFDCLDETHMIINSKELSSMFVVETKETNAIKYIISNESFFEETQYKDYVYEPIGNFEPFYNQTQMIVTRDDSRFVEGQYYISITDSKNGWYQMFVDENTKTFTLANQIRMKQEESLISTEYVNDQILCLLKDSQGVILLKCYNSEGEVLESYQIDVDKIKLVKAKQYDFTGFWTN